MQGRRPLAAWYCPRARLRAPPLVPLVRGFACALTLCALLGAPGMPLIALLLPAIARADGVADEAEINFRLGAERYQAGDFRAALAFFLASRRLAPNRNVRFNIVRTFQRLGMHA
jgi:hypothetical protein